MSDLQVIGAFGEGTLHRHLVRSSGRQKVLIDLNRMRWCEPLGLVCIASFAEHHVRSGMAVEVVRPQESSVANYLARVHLGEVLNELGVEHNLPIVKDWDVGHSLLELRCFDDSEGVASLSAHVFDALESQSGIIAAALHKCVGEAGANVLEHSQPGRVGRGYVAAQRTNKGRQLSFAVSDPGVGLLGSLRDKGPRDDGEAVQLAYSRAGSRYDAPTRGYGIPDMAGHVTGLGGTLELASGRAVLVATGRTVRVSISPRALPGTLLQGSVPIR